MDAVFSAEETAARAAVNQQAEVKTSSFAENVIKAYLGMRPDTAFKAQLESLIKNDMASLDLRQITRDEVQSMASGGGSVPVSSPGQPDALKDLVSLGQFNEATFLNISHITGDSFQIKSALNVYRQGNKDEEITPINEVDGQVGEDS